MLHNDLHPGLVLILYRVKLTEKKLPLRDCHSLTNQTSSDVDIKGHTDEVLSLALSGDGKLLASAGKDRRLGVWDTEKAEWIKGFSGRFGHKDTISVCSFLSRPIVLALTAASSESCFSERNQSTLLQFL